MSLFNTLATGASGLTATGSGLAVIGDNIANISTTGFKKNRVNFEDMLPEQMGTRHGTSQLGRGTNVANIAVLHTAGAIENSSSALDCGINGAGFFEISNGVNKFYTRDGNFHVNKDSFLVSSSGMKVQGYAVESGTVLSTVGDLQLDLGPIEQNVTTEIELHAHLSADAEYTDVTGSIVTPYASLTLDGTAAGASIKEASEEADYSTSITVYDSLGLAHDVTVFFERTDTNDWSWSAVVDGGELDGATHPDDEGQAFEIADGTMTFDTDGNMTNFTEAATSTAWNWPGADPFSVSFKVGLDPATMNPDSGEVVMVGSESFTSIIAQDGYPTSHITNVAVDPNGTIAAQYYNGEERVLGQLALADFPGENGLARLGGNLFVPTRESGDPAMGAPGSGGRGQTIGYALERSNVDMEEEFVQMIQTQRSYQANAGVIRSSDQSLQVLVNLV